MQFFPFRFREVTTSDIFVYCTFNPFISSFIHWNSFVHKTCGSSLKRVNNTNLNILGVHACVNENASIFNGKVRSRCKNSKIWVLFSLGNLTSLQCHWDCSSLHCVRDEIRSICRLVAISAVTCLRHFFTWVELERESVSEKVNDRVRA